METPSVCFGPTALKRARGSALRPAGVLSSAPGSTPWQHAGGSQDRAQHLQLIYYDAQRTPTGPGPQGFADPPLGAVPRKAHF